ncbi:MAG: glycosyltransferase family 9 protein, partial [Bdellovibrionota bacterium]
MSNKIIDSNTLIMKKLLIIKPSSLGDIIHGLQIATTIKHFKPEIEINWVVREIFKPIVENCEAVDKVYVFERKGGPFAFIKLIKQIRTQRFNWTFDLQGLARS